MTTAMPGEKRDFAPLERAQNIGVRGIAERRFLLHFPDIGEAGHAIQPTAADDSDFCLRQIVLP